MNAVWLAREVPTAAATTTETATQTAVGTVTQTHMYSNTHSAQKVGDSPIPPAESEGAHRS